MATSRIVPSGIEDNLVTGDTPVTFADALDTGEWVLTQAECHGQMLIYTNAVVADLCFNFPTAKTGLAVMVYNPRADLFVVVGMDGNPDKIFINGVQPGLGQNWSAADAEGNPSGHEAALFLCDGTNWNAVWTVGTWSLL